ncbi:hypothetical protein [Simiduia aestuariiviva]|uniref:Uncharacterized protein n=1 Tax=Simiduia aestuariiviva TaxID=1510459 RepID=A0A839UQN5_9GAMM|nr:hypothetical protein [Simiduia aestuariiviva]MBB3170152.1 hypothetical protein [Simiduia aestuariiviva]
MKNDHFKALQNLSAEENFEAYMEAMVSVGPHPDLLRAAQFCKERFSHIPFYAERAKKYPDFWLNFAAGSVNIGLDPSTGEL